MIDKVHIYNIFCFDSHHLFIESFSNNVQADRYFAASIHILYMVNNKINYIFYVQPTPKYGHYAWLVALCVFLAVPAKFLLPECQFSYMLYENAYIYSLSVFRPA
jgi:hypothetical protein